VQLGGAAQGAKGESARQDARAGDIGPRHISCREYRMRGVSVRRGYLARWRLPRTALFCHSDIRRERGSCGS
jgi:hypothetical protein